MTKQNDMVVDFKLSARQTEAQDALESEGVSEVLYGGAKGGGKSVFLCFYAVLYAIWIIALCKITTIQKYPYVIGFIGRVRSVDFSATTLVTWKKFIPKIIYDYNEQKKIITLFGKVSYQCGGLDDTNDIKKFNSAEYGLVIIDQAEETVRDQAAMLRGTQGRANINGVALPIKTLFSANPADCFLKDDFGITPGTICPPFRKFIQALPSDNPFIDSVAYVAQLTEAWKHHPEILKAYVEGDWLSVTEGGFLIDRDTCSRLQLMDLPKEKKYSKILISCDPAWLGDKTDEIVIKCIIDNRVVDTKKMYNEKTTVTGGECVKMALQYGASDIFIDTIGVGAGVYDNCLQLLQNQKKNINVVRVNSAERPENDLDKQKFVNVRAEMWWKATEKLRENKFLLEGDGELIREICAVKYFIKNGKIQIESKDDIKKRLGRSPDNADCVIQGIWALDKVEAQNISKATDYDVDTTDLEFNSMTV